MDRSAHYRDQANHARQLAIATWQPNLRDLLRHLARDFDGVAEDIETGAIEIRHAELLDGVRSLPHLNVLGRHPEQARERQTGIRPVPHHPRPRSLPLAVLCALPTDEGFSAPYDISYRGLKLSKVSASLGPLLPAARGRFAAGGPSAPGHPTG